jgi:hypothetical protein
MMKDCFLLMRRVLCLMAAAAAIAVLAACSSPADPPRDEKTMQFNELAQRPDIDQATARYEEMFGKIRDQLSATFPALMWKQSNPATTAACDEEFAAVDARTRHNDAVIKGLANWLAEGKVPDEGWDKAVTIVDTVARSYGFNSGPIVVKNQPSDHYVTFHDPYKAELTLGTAVNTGMTVRTGCHLTAEAKKRGTPEPTPTY